MMYKSLSEFYTGKEWRNFRNDLILQRTDSNGILRDEHNGEPIVNSYDIILHHKQQLTLQNVNDVSVSLNPDNIMIVSHKSHNGIHNRFGYSQGRKVYVVYGAPCSGKSTWVKNNMGNSDIVADIDMIWQALTGQKYYKPNALKSNAFDLYNRLLDMIRTRQGRWDRAYIITGGAHKGQRERLISDMGAEPVFIDTDKTTCLNRLGDDEDRRNVAAEWAGYILEWFEKFQE